MPIPEDFIQELKQRADIADIISSYTKLKKQGRNLVGSCPFPDHHDSTPSFSVVRENGYFHCFGCGVGGDVITFIRKMENLDYVDAVKFLAQKTGMTVPEDNASNSMTQLRTRIYEANREAARFYHKMLYAPEGAEALSYLRGRKLTEKTIVHFGLGYAPKSFFELVNHLHKKGFSNAELIQANLAVQTARGSVRDRFSDRVMFPIINVSKNVIAFGGRIMSDIKPKYLNTSDTPVFNKSRNLFALNFAKNKANGQLILVEGYMDVIALHQAGFENAVATLGTALTPDQAKIIKRYCEEVVICYDADEAGQKATVRAIPLLRSAGLQVRVLTVPNGKDPDEFMKSYGDQGPGRFRMLLEKTGNDADYQLQRLRSRYHLESTEQRVAFLTEAARLIAGFDNSIEQDIYITKLSQELEVEKAAIRQQVSRFEHRSRREEISRRQREVSRTLSAVNDQINREKPFNLRAANAEEALLSVLILYPSAAQSVFEQLSPEQFVTTFNRKVYETLRQRAEKGYEFTLTDISGEFSVDEVSRIAKMLSSHPRENDPEAAAEDYIQILREEADKLSPEAIESADNQELLARLARLRQKKQ